MSKEDIQALYVAYSNTSVSNDIKRHHLSKSEDMNELRRIDKIYNLLPNLNAINYKEIEKIKEKKQALRADILGDENIQRLTNSLLSKFLDRNVVISDHATSHEVFDIKRAFIQRRIEDFGDEFLTWKSISMTNKINAAFSFDFTRDVLKDINKLFTAWEWSSGNYFESNSVLLENVRASTKQENKEENSMLEAILFEEVYNKKFEKINPESTLEQFSYLMIEGTYLLNQKTSIRFPFHAIYGINAEGKLILKIDEFVLANQGTPFTYYDGKKRGGKYYYDKDHPRLMRRIKG